MGQGQAADQNVLGRLAEAPQHLPLVQVGEAPAFGAVAVGHPRRQRAVERIDVQRGALPVGIAGPEHRQALEDEAVVVVEALLHLDRLRLAEAQRRGVVAEALLAVAARSAVIQRLPRTAQVAHAKHAVGGQLLQPPGRRPVQQHQIEPARARAVVRPARLRCRVQPGDRVARLERRRQRRRTDLVPQMPAAADREAAGDQRQQQAEPAVRPPPPRRAGLPRAGEEQRDAQRRRGQQRRQQQAHQQRAQQAGAVQPAEAVHGLEQPAEPGLALVHQGAEAVLVEIQVQTQAVLARRIHPRHRQQPVDEGVLAVEPAQAAGIAQRLGRPQIVLRQALGMAGQQIGRRPAARVPVARLGDAGQARLIVGFAIQHQQAQGLHFAEARRAEHRGRRLQPLQRQQVRRRQERRRARLQVAHQRVQHATGGPAEHPEAGQQRQAPVPRQEPQHALAPARPQPAADPLRGGHSRHSRPAYRLRPSPGRNCALSCPLASAITPVVAA